MLINSHQTVPQSHAKVNTQPKSAAWRGVSERSSSITNAAIDSICSHHTG
jgi:hypothetical protein